MHYFQFHEKITSSNNNLETEFNSQVYILLPAARCKPGSLWLLLHMLQFLLCFPQRRKLDAQAGWKATMRDKPVPKASLEVQDNMLPNWPNLSPPATALENPCTCWWLWQLSCQLLFAGCHQSGILARLQAQHGISWRVARKKVEVGGKQLCLYKSFGAWCRERGTVGSGKSHISVSRQL